MALQLVFDAAQKGHCLVHLQLGLVDSHCCAMLHVQHVQHLRHQLISKKKLFCSEVSYQLRSASEIHPQKRQFLRDNFQIKQFPG